MTMRKVDPAGLATYLEKYLNSGDYRRLIRQRFFRATVATTANSGRLVSLVRVGEAQSDGGQYWSAYPASVGDQVMCVWVDEASAVVLFPTAQLPTQALQNPGPSLFDTQTISTDTVNVRIPKSGSFPTTASSIEIHYRMRQDSPSDTIAVGMTFNGDGQGNYSGEFIQGLGTTASANEQNGVNFIHPNWIIPGNTTYAQAYGWGRVFIPFYGSSLQPKGVRIDFNSIAAHAAGAANGLYTVSLGAYWNSAAPIQYLTIAPGPGQIASAQFKTYLWP